MIVYFNVLESEVDRDVCQKLYEENKQRLFRIAYKILQNTADAEDAVQSCFSKIIDDFERYRDKPYVEMVMLCQTIVKHNAIDIIRKHRKMVSFSDEVYLGEDAITDCTPDILDELVERYEQNLVVKAITELEEEEREMLYLQYVSCMKPKDVAKLLHTTSDVVRKKSHRSRIKLAGILEGYEHEGK